jgi:hypothetical protein
MKSIGNLSHSTGIMYSNWTSVLQLHVKFKGQYPKSFLKMLYFASDTFAVISSMIIRKKTLVERWKNIALIYCRTVAILATRTQADEISTLLRYIRESAHTFKYQSTIVQYLQELKKTFLFFVLKKICREMYGYLMNIVSIFCSFKI